MDGGGGNIELNLYQERRGERPEGEMNWLKLFGFVRERERERDGYEY